MGHSFSQADKGRKYSYLVLHCEQLSDEYKSFAEAAELAGIVVALKEQADMHH